MNIQKRIYTALFLCAALLLAGCTHDSDSTLPAPAGKVTLTVLASSATTRAILNETTAATSPWYWSEGDKLCVVDPAGGVVGYLTIDAAYSDAAPATSAQFSGTVSSDNIKNGVTYRFWYLGSAATDLTAGTTTATLDLSSQTGTLAGLSSHTAMTGTAMAYVEGTTAYAADLTLTPLLSTAHFATTSTVTLTSLILSGTGVCNSITYNLATAAATAATAGNITFTDATGTGNFTSLYVTLPASAVTPVFTSSSRGLSLKGTLPKATFVAGTHYRANAGGDPIQVYVKVLQSTFSVSATQKVYFSQGNLQYVPSTGVWSFCAHQYDYAQGNINPTTRYTSTGSEPIDLLGWATSGRAVSGASYAPYLTSTNGAEYATAITTTGATLTGTYAAWDWGANVISNGGGTAGLWRTLTKDEWYYLFNTRSNAASLYGYATVNSVKGLVILPDSWALPASCTFTATTSSFDTNTYTASQWNDMETAGAVFLPSAGYRSGTKVAEVTSGGNYWSSTAIGNNGAYIVRFYTNSFSATYNSNRSSGISVRLVQDE